MPRTAPPSVRRRSGLPRRCPSRLASGTISFRTSSVAKSIKLTSRSPGTSHHRRLLHRSQQGVRGASIRPGHVTAERGWTSSRVKDLKPQRWCYRGSTSGQRQRGGESTAGGCGQFLESTTRRSRERRKDRRLSEAERDRCRGRAVEATGRKGWRDRMTAAGFDQVVFGGEVVESARSLLRKYDNGWEMSTVAAAKGGGGAVALRWKGQPVSFCSLWRPA
ncbi:hypothetical protein ZWY2020_028853 [Hordeum vulgare]|nr:hypothetical protein ZWY2020_028853 [Hordeum vulgare]